MEIKLTQYSKGSGCGCKIAPKVLEEILSGHKSYHTPNKQLIAGIGHNEDAAVYDIETEQYLISTNDFFTPVVDDAFDFGRIASANAISDVYAMGGKPILAIAILGWPVEKLSPSLANEVVNGARATCNEAGIILAGGHSIDSPEPFFGLSVNGLVEPSHLKRNNSAKKNDLLYITKKLGVGILSAAGKKGKLKSEHYAPMIEQMTMLNNIGEKLGKKNYVTAMTDITGFGLLGHLTEMADGSQLSAEINYKSIPLFDELDYYISQACVPDNTYRNWNNYEKKTEGISAESLITLCDPQTNGGLLIAVSEEFREDFEKFLCQNNLTSLSKPIGKITEKKENISVLIS